MTVMEVHGTSPRTLLLILATLVTRNRNLRTYLFAAREGTEAMELLPTES
jgi:hypothetical protein